MDHVLYPIYKIALNIYSEKHEEKAVHPSTRIYINKMENKITLQIKTGYYLELLTPKTMTLLGNTKSKITKKGKR